MRVIAGKYKSRKLNEFKNPTTRPTLDRVKEGIFSKIQFLVSDATVLDLFSGTGGLGIEALSRGAKQVYFVDNNKIAFNLIKQNLHLLNEDMQPVLNINFDVALQKFKSENIKFDIVLLDPPFNKGLAHSAIDMILKLGLLNDNATIVYECDATEEIKTFEGLTEPEIKKYGTVKVLYYYN